MAQFWKFPLNAPFQTANAATLASFTTAADIFPAPIGPVLPANSVFAGLGISVMAWGTLSAVSSATFNFGLYWGGAASGVLICNTGTQTPAATPVNVPWRMEVDLIFRATGSGTAGSVESNGICWIGSSVSALSNALPMPNTALAAVGIDTTAAKLLSPSVACSVSSASNLVIGRGLKVYADT